MHFFHSYEYISPKKVCSKFGLNWPSGSEFEEDSLQMSSRDWPKERHCLTLVYPGDKMKILKPHCTSSIHAQSNLSAPSNVDKVSVTSVRLDGQSGITTIYPNSL